MDAITIGLGSANTLKLAKITTSQNVSTMKNGTGIALSLCVKTSIRVRPISVVAWTIRDFSEACSSLAGVRPSTAL